MNENDTIPEGEPIDDEPMHLHDLTMCPICQGMGDDDHASWCGDDASMTIDFYG